MGRGLLSKPALLVTNSHGVNGAQCSSAGEGINLVRDVFQLFSILISIATLGAILLRVRRFHEHLREWIAFIFISISTIIYYVLVFIDQRYDIFNASDVSSTLRLASQIALALYVIYTPRRIHL